MRTQTKCEYAITGISNETIRTKITFFFQSAKVHTELAYPSSIVLLLQGCAFE